MLVPSSPDNGVTETKIVAREPPRPWRTEPDQTTESHGADSRSAPWMMPTIE